MDRYVLLSISNLEELHVSVAVNVGMQNGSKEGALKKGL